MPMKLNFKRTHRYNVSAKDLHVVRIYTLDGTCVEYSVSSTTTGKDALEYVAQRLDISDTCLFGLKYECWNGENRWLFLSEPVKRQLDRNAGQHVLVLTIMLFIDNPQFISDPQLRRFLYLQLRQDVCAGILPVTLKLGIKLTAYSLQADFGDFTDVETALKNWKDCCFFEQITPCRMFDLASTEYVDDILWGYLHLQGVTQANAVWYFLDEIRHCSLYGVYTFKGSISHNEVAELEISRNGLSLVSFYTRPSGESSTSLKWEQIKDLSYSRKSFTIQPLKKKKSIHMLLNDGESARYLWQFCIQLHSSCVEYWARVRSTRQQPIVHMLEPPDILRGTENRHNNLENSMSTDGQHQGSSSPREERHVKLPSSPSTNGHSANLREPLAVAVATGTNDEDADENTLESQLLMPRGCTAMCLPTTKRRRRCHRMTCDVGLSPSSKGSEEKPSAESKHSIDFLLPRGSHQHRHTPHHHHQNDDEIKPGMSRQAYIGPRKKPTLHGDNKMAVESESQLRNVTNCPHPLEEHSRGSSVSSLASSETSEDQRDTATRRGHLAIRAPQESLSTSSSSSASEVNLGTSPALLGGKPACHEDEDDDEDSCTTSTSNSLGRVHQLQTGETRKKHRSDFSVPRCPRSRHERDSALRSSHLVSVLDESRGHSGRPSVDLPQEGSKSRKTVWYSILERAKKADIRNLLTRFHQRHYRPQAQIRRTQAAATAVSKTLPNRDQSSEHHYSGGLLSNFAGRSNSDRRPGQPPTKHVLYPTSSQRQVLGGGRHVNDLQRWLNSAKQRIPTAWTGVGRLGADLQRDSDRLNTNGRADHMDQAVDRLHRSYLVNSFDTGPEQNLLLYDCHGDKPAAYHDNHAVRGSGDSHKKQSTRATASPPRPSAVCPPIIQFIPPTPSNNSSILANTTHNTNESSASGGAGSSSGSCVGPSGCTDRPPTWTATGNQLIADANDQAGRMALQKSGEVRQLQRKGAVRGQFSASQRLECEVRGLEHAVKDASSPVPGDKHAPGGSRSQSRGERKPGNDPSIFSGRLAWETDQQAPGANVGRINLSSYLAIKYPTGESSTSSTCTTSTASQAASTTLPGTAETPQPNKLHRILEVEDRAVGNGPSTLETVGCGRTGDGQRNSFSSASGTTMHLLTNSDIHQLLCLTNVPETGLVHRLLMEYRQIRLDQHSLYNNKNNSISTPNLTTATNTTSSQDTGENQSSLNDKGKYQEEQCSSNEEDDENAETGGNSLDSSSCGDNAMTTNLTDNNQMFASSTTAAAEDMDLEEVGQSCQPGAVESPGAFPVTPPRPTLLPLEGGSPQTSSRFPWTEKANHFPVPGSSHAGDHKCEEDGPSAPTVDVLQQSLTKSTDSTDYVNVAAFCNNHECQQHRLNRNTFSSSATDLESMATFHVLSSLTSTVATETPSVPPTTSTGHPYNLGSPGYTATARHHPTVPEKEVVSDRLVSQHCLLLFSLPQQKHNQQQSAVLPTPIGQSEGANGSHSKKTSVSFELNHLQTGRPSPLLAKDTCEVVGTKLAQPELVTGCLYGQGRTAGEAANQVVGHVDPRDLLVGENRQGQYENLMLLKTSAKETALFLLDSSAVPLKQSSILNHNRPQCVTSTASPSSYEYLTLPTSPTTGAVVMTNTLPSPLATATTASVVGQQSSQLLIPNCLPSSPSSSSTSSSGASKPPDVLVSADWSPVDLKASTAGNSPSSSITSSELVWDRKPIRHVRTSPRGPSMKSRLNSLLRQPVRQLTKSRKRRPSVGQLDPTGSCHCHCHHQAGRSNSLRLGPADALVETSKKAMRPKARSLDPFSSSAGRRWQGAENKLSFASARSQHPPNPSSSTSSNSFYYKLLTDREKTGRLVLTVRPARDHHRQADAPPLAAGKSHESVAGAQMRRPGSCSSLSRISSSSSTTSIPSTVSTAGSSTASASNSSTSSSLDVRMTNNNSPWHHQQQPHQQHTRHSETRRQRHWRQKCTSCRQRTDRAATFDHVKGETTKVATRSTSPGLPRYYVQQQHQHNKYGYRPGERHRGHRFDEFASGEVRRKVDTVSKDKSESSRCQHQADSNCCTCQSNKAKISTCSERRRMTLGFPGTATLSCQCLQALPRDEDVRGARFGVATATSRPARVTSGSPTQLEKRSGNSQRWSSSARISTLTQELGKGPGQRSNSPRIIVGSEHLANRQSCGCSEQSRAWPPWSLKNASGSHNRRLE